MDDPFSDLIPQGGSQQGGGIPVTRYSIPKSALGGNQGDEMSDPNTARGVGISENELGPAVVAVNPSVYPYGTIFRNAQTNEVFIAGDKHGNENPNVVDLYSPPSAYRKESGTMPLVPIDRIRTNQIPKSYSGVSELLANYGKVPEGEGAYTSLGKKQQQEDPFADLIPQAQGNNAPAQPQAQEQTADPFADLLPQQQAQAQTNPDAAFLTAPSPTQEQTGKPINLPAINPIDNALRNFANTAATSTLNTVGGAVRYFNNAQQKDLKMAQEELAQAQESGESPEQINEIQGRINRFNEQIPQVQEAVKSITDLSNQYPEAYGVSPEDKSTSAQIGRGLGQVASFMPTMALGPAGAPLGALQGASQAYEGTYQQTLQSLESQGVTDKALMEDKAQREASIAAVKSLPQLATYMVGGKLASAGVSKLLSTQKPLIQGAAGAVAGSIMNTAAGATIRKIMGESVMPTVESLTQDIAFGLFHGVGTGVEAQEKLRFEEQKRKLEEQKLGGPAPEVAPSSNPEVNKKEAEILASADAQAPAPEVVVTDVRATVPDLTSLIEEQLFLKEGSPEYAAIQKQIDDLNKPTEETTPAGDIKQGVGGLGGGINDSLFKTLWDKVTAGEVTENGKPSAVLTAAKRLRELGGLTTIEEFRSFANEFAGISELPKEQRLDALNALAEKYTKPTELTPAKEPTPAPPDAGGELTANLVESGTSLESFGKDSLVQLAEYYGVDVPKDASRGEIIDAINAKRTAEAPTEKAEAAKEVVVPASLEEAETPEEVDAFVKSEREKLKSRFRTDTDNAELNSRNRESIGKQSKALGMQAAARKRQITGQLTAKEQAAKDKREASNYVGKPVSVDGRNGTIIGNPFGRVKVRFSDGTESTHLPEKIEAPVEVEAPTEVAPTEPIKPQEVTLTEEQQAEKVLLDKIDAEAGKPKAPKAKAPEENPYEEISRRYESGEEDSINTPTDLVNEVSKLARKKQNQYLKDAVDRYYKAMDVSADVEPEVQKLLDNLKRESNRYKAPKSEKVPKRKTAKDRALDVLGDAANKLTYVLENKILDPATYKKMVKSGIIEGGGEYDFFYNSKLPKKVRDLIFKRDGSPIDEVAGAMGKTPYELLSEIQEAYIAKEKLDQETKAREQEEKALQEEFKRMEALKKTNPEAYAQKEEQEVTKFLIKASSREGGFIEFPDFIKDAAIRVGDSVRKGVTSFKEWSSEMVSRFGEGVRNFLKDIWAGVRDNWNKDIGGGLDTGGRSLERASEEARAADESRFAPKTPTEQEAFAKKAADAILKGRGTPITEQEMGKFLARMFPGISPSEVSDLYATASGRPKTPAPYAGQAVAQETPEQISIRRKDQEDQVRRGILTSVIDTAQGLSDANLIERGRQNLANGVDPNQALEQARQGEPEALSTARAYFETVLAPRASEALKTKGPKSPEYLKASKEATDYYQGIREGLSAASEALRTAKGQVDLTDASAIAREYTIQTGEEPTLSQHDQIRKVADKVDRTIKESDKASEYHKVAMDEGLAEVEVQTPASVEEGRQQVADLSDAQGKKAKNEIDRLNNELEQTKKDLEEVRQAKATGQDAESLKAYYEAKLKDLQGQLETQPKFGKEVLDQAQKLVDKWKADRLEAEKLLTKQLAQMGSFPDVSIVATIARIMRGHISELGLDFARSSKMILEKFGPKAEKYLKEAWAKADALIKGEDGGEKAVKTVRKAKAKPVAKMTPEEKTAESLRKRIAQAEKKINDLNSGKITTPKEVEKVTNDEIKRLEDEYSQKKKELADARLKAKQRELFEQGKVGDDLNPEQVKTLWESAKRFYLDKGESDYDKMISDLASDFGLTPQQVRKAFGTPKGAKRASDEMYLKQRNRQMALDEAKRWLDNQKASWIGRVFGAAAEKTFKLAIFGHGTAFIGTHAPSTLYTNPKLALKAWLKGLSYSFTGKDGRIQNIVDNKDLINRPSWIVARKGGLENDPREIRREGATPTRSDSAIAKALDTISGGRGFDALFHLRQDMFDQAWQQLSVTQRTPEMAEMYANAINNATGFTKGGKASAGILQSPITKILFFAPKLIASRFKWLIQDPARMLGTFGKMANPFLKVSPEERMSAIYEAKNKAKFLGVMTGTLLANQALLSITGSNQSVNFLDPKKRDWLAYKGFGYELATIGAFTRIFRLVAQEYNAVFGELSRWQKAKGGREQAMKDAVYTYLRSGFSPITRDIIVASTGKDYVGNTVPWSKEQPDRGRRKLTWRELIQEQFAPIPISEAATQKEVLPAVVKAGSAAFLGTRADTPRDIEEYEKSLKSKSSSKSSKPFYQKSSQSKKSKPFYAK
jgi:3D (Asp-Asp-Asp) domain-containing protein/antitoxin (DNA-binding transcriptional repressor) of toxin-antitoxin stability system